MQLIYDNFTTIVGFMVICVIINTVTDNETLNAFLMLILLSIKVINAKAFITLIKGVTP